MPERATSDWSPPRRSEKSAEAVVAEQWTAKGRTERRAKRLWISTTWSAEVQKNLELPLATGVKPREQSGARKRRRRPMEPNAQERAG
jgi:hypothetical protein